MKRRLWKRDWRFALSALVILSAIQPTRLFCQDSGAEQETYDGQPVYKVGRGVKAPRATYQPMPEYDEKGRKTKTEGTVTLSMIVTRDGRTTDIKVTKSLTPGLDAQAIKAVTQWKFDPATKDGEPVAVRVAVETSFRIAH